MRIGVISDTHGLLRPEVAPAPIWGAMLNDARSHLFDSPHLVIFPALAVAAAVLGFNFIGDALRDRLDPRTRLELGL